LDFLFLCFSLGNQTKPEEIKGNQRKTIESTQPQTKENHRKSKETKGNQRKPKETKGNQSKTIESNQPQTKENQRKPKETKGKL